MLQWLADTWDAVELWVAQLWFPVQFALVMVVLLPVCLGVAWLIDRVVDRLSALLAPRYRAEPTLWGRDPEQQGDDNRAAGKRPDSPS
ncbi:MAG: hypothetical protein JOZ47_13485 [Kutzneria sp.]|nr:hypothetical protein [Kutzneria sp.]